MTDHVRTFLLRGRAGAPGLRTAKRLLPNSGGSVGGGNARCVRACGTRACAAAPKASLECEREQSDRPLCRRSGLGPVSGRHGRRLGSLRRPPARCGASLSSFRRPAREARRGRGRRMRLRDRFDSLVNGRPVGLRRAPIPPGGNCPGGRAASRLGPGDLFLLSPNWDAFDGRYFGVTRASEVIGKARLVWPG